MWKCKHCGGTRITCNAKGTYFAYSTPDENGIADTSQIDISDITFDDDPYTDLYWCEDCMKEEKDIHQLAEWIKLEKIYFKDLKKGMTICIDEEKYTITNINSYGTVDLENQEDKSSTAIDAKDFDNLNFYIEVQNYEE